jgi:hypothetical protein
VRAVLVVAGALAVLGCGEAPTTLRVQVGLAPGVTVSALSARVTVGGVAGGYQGLEPSRVPGDLIVVLPDAAQPVTVAFAGTAGDGASLSALASAQSVPHQEVTVVVQLGESGNVPDLAGQDRATGDLAATLPDLASADLSMTLGTDLSVSFDLAPSGADSSPPPRLLFVSPLAQPGDLGTLDQIDMTCLILATVAGLPGNFRALITDSNLPITARIALDQGRDIVRPDGVVVANDSTFFTANHLAPMNVDANGQVIGNNANAWTGFDPTGTQTAESCSGWSSGVGTVNGVIGLLTSTTSTWADNGSAPCNRVAHLICIEQ